MQVFYLIFILVQNFPLGANTQNKLNSLNQRINLKFFKNILDPTTKVSILLKNFYQKNVEEEYDLAN